MKTRLFAVLLLLTGLAACAPAGSAVSTVPSFSLATPVSDQPAAGICAEPEGKVVVFTILPGIPDPRCAKVRPDQTLQVVNRTDGPLEVNIGTFTASLEPGGAHSFDVPFGNYLAPGVHFLRVSPCCGPEIWLQAGSQ